MKVNKPNDNSVENGHLSDRIGQMGANFNRVQGESIGFSVYYATMGALRRTILLKTCGYAEFNSCCQRCGVIRPLQQ